MFHNKLVILFIFIFQIGFSQEAPQGALHVYENIEVRGDTLYVVEEIKISDTVYVELPQVTTVKVVPQAAKETVSKKKKNKFYWLGLRLRLLSNTLLRQETILNSSSVREDVFSYEPQNENWRVGLKAHTGKTHNSFFKEFNVPEKTVFGLGFWVRKQLFKSNFSFGLGVDTFFYTEQSLLTISDQDSNYNSYFFTESGAPLLFKYIKSNSYQIQVPFQLAYTLNRFVVSGGGYVSYCDYTIGMYGSSSSGLDTVQDFKAEVVQVGYTAELQYYIQTHLSIGLIASYGGFENLVFVSKDNQVFKSINSFKESKGLIQLTYTF